ncbi:putative heat shock protein 30 [Rosellinia necatrix]|uniref:Putative heat shock protein 30 n=1 Tax=Rosellinia necatrix TaxID=77044 RepID=A0A1S7UJF9_ROSNE|nr:putative heat shock protein 30 [Rosellinia necatrix]
MSAFAHHPFYATPNNDFGKFGGLVRFIDDWDKHFSQQNDRRGNGQFRQARRVQTFNPRFDVRETEQGYELHGELPGVEKKDINIEFSDQRSIVISGRVERTYTAGTPPAGLLSDSAVSGAIVDEAHSDDGSETHSNKSFQATVEDEAAEDNDATAAGTTTAVDTPKPETAVAEPQQPQQQQQQQQQQKEKFWIQERSVGSFSRTFAFASHIDYENVTASMENGILTVSVPKAKKPETRRIAIH